MDNDRFNRNVVSSGIAGSFKINEMNSMSIFQTGDGVVDSILICTVVNQFGVSDGDDCTFFRDGELSGLESYIVVTAVVGNIEVVDIIASGSFSGIAGDGDCVAVDQPDGAEIDLRIGFTVNFGSIADGDFKISLVNGQCSVIKGYGVVFSGRKCTLSDSISSGIEIAAGAGSCIFNFQRTGESVTAKEYAIVGERVLFAVSGGDIVGRNGYFRSIDDNIVFVFDKGYTVVCGNIRTVVFNDCGGSGNGVSSGIFDPGNGDTGDGIAVDQSGSGEFVCKLFRTIVGEFSIVNRDAQISLFNGEFSGLESYIVVAVCPICDGNFVFSDVFTGFALQTQAGIIVCIDQIGDNPGEFLICFTVYLTLGIDGDGNIFSGDFSCGIDSDGIGAENIAGSKAVQAAESGAGDIINIGAVKERTGPAQFHFHTVNRNFDGGVVNFCRSVILLRGDGTIQVGRIWINCNQFLIGDNCADISRGSANLSQLIGCNQSCCQSDITDNGSFFTVKSPAVSDGGVVLVMPDKDTFPMSRTACFDMNRTVFVQNSFTICIYFGKSIGNRYIS